MGIFDGVLICSDIDGTLTVDMKTIPENIEAIKFFTKEGGRFSIATGRTAAYLKTMDFFGLINAPACICNGSVVYDYEKEEILRIRCNDFSLGEFLSCIGNMRDGLEGLYVYYNPYSVQAPNTAKLAFTDAELADKPIKIVCTFKEKSDADHFKNYCLENPFFNNTFISNSWDTGVEFNPLDGTKGSAVDFIKKSLADIHTSVAIGDWENDIPMLKAADIGVFVTGGIPALAPCSDFSVCPAADGAVAELIHRLEQRLKG